MVTSLVPINGGGADVWSQRDAMWLGQRAAQAGAAEKGRELVPAEMIPYYEQGLALPEGTSVTGVTLPAATRKRLLRQLGAPPEADVEVPLRLDSIHVREDIGTASRYDVTLTSYGRTVTLRDLRGADLLRWERLREIAVDQRLILPSIQGEQKKRWLTLLSRAMERATVAPMEALGSEAIEVRDIIASAMSEARDWSWSEEDPYPRGIARVVWGSMEGWPRGALMREIRSSCGSVGRVALRRALVDLRLEAIDWRIETAHLRVWAREATL